MRHIERNLSWMLLLTLALMLLVQVVARYIFFTSISWIEEFSRIVFIWFIYLTISWIILQGRHIRVNAIDLIMPASWARPVAFLADALWMAFNVLMTYFGYLYVRSEIDVWSETDILQIPEAAVHSIIPIGFGLMTIRLAQYMYRVYVKGEPEVLYDVEKQEEER